MKKAVLILFVCGLGFLIVGSVLAIPSIRGKLPTWTITSTGTIACPDEWSSQAAKTPLPQQTSDHTNLDKIGYLTILASIGFFTAGLVINRKRNRIASVPL